MQIFPKTIEEVSNKLSKHPDKMALLCILYYTFAKKQKPPFFSYYLCSGGNSSLSSNATSDIQLHGKHDTR